MTAQTQITVTLPPSSWSTIRTAVLCIAADARLEGKDLDADHFMAAYRALKEAMGR